jgi:type II secretory pathway component GspD/PulD (secretin)
LESDEMKRASLVAALLVATLSTAAPAAAPALQVQVKPRKLVAAVQDPADAKIAAALKAKKVSFDFVDTPVRDAVAFMRQLLGVNVVLDPAVDGNRTLTLKVKDMAAGKALGWMAAVAGAEMKIQDGAVYIAATKKKQVGGGRVGYQPVARYQQYRRTVGRAEIKLGDLASISLTLYDDDLPEDTRAMLLKLLHKALARELKELEAKKK